MMKTITTLIAIFSIFCLTSCETIRLPQNFKSIKIKSPHTGNEYTLTQDEKGGLDLLIDPTNNKHEETEIDASK